LEKVRETDNARRRQAIVNVKHLIFLFLFLPGFVIFAPSSLRAAGYPDHPIQLVITNVAGAMVDITGRMLAEEMGQILGQKIIPNNKPGAGTVLGTDFVLRSKKDEIGRAHV
jgi:tripartite-type tricarboxylate transporter receptor subunit TctC